MIEVYHIVSNPYLKYFEKYIPKKFVMAMAQVVLDSSFYTKYFLSIKNRGAKIILDNGTPYIGQSVADKDLVEAAYLVKPDILILPDILEDSNGTKKRIGKFIDERSANLNVQFMGVIQGKSIQEYIESYIYILKNPIIKYIGIPYIPEYLHFTREDVINILVINKIIDNSKHHHLLGLSHSGHIELRKLKKFNFIKTCDSSAAFKMAVINQEIKDNYEYKKTNNKMNFYVKYNIAVAEMALKNARCIDNCAK